MQSQKTKKTLGTLLLGITLELMINNVSAYEPVKKFQECRYIIEAPNITNIPPKDGLGGATTGYLTIFLPDEAIQKFFPDYASHLQPGERISIKPKDVRKLAEQKTLVEKYNGECEYVTVDNNPKECYTSTTANDFRRAADTNRKNVDANGQWNLLLEGNGGIFHQKYFAFQHKDYGYPTGSKCRK